MKKMKKFFALVLSFAMVLAMGITASAEDAGSATGTAKTYTITAPATKHQYEIYQIFTGDLSSDGILSNVKWGANGTGTAGDAVASDILETLAGIKNNTSDSTKLNTISQYAKLDSTPVATISNGATYSAAPGYYLIKDKDGSVSGDKADAYTTYIVTVVGDVTINPKSNVPMSDKKVKDTNDSEGTTTDWQSSADYDIGDDVPFQLTGTVTSKYDDYKTYKYVFHDKESAGLTFNRDSVKVYVDGNEITSGYEVVTSTTDGDTFDVVFSDLKKISSVKAGSTITVEYTSKLNDKAVLGATGNPNTMHLEFSNNPNAGGQGETGKTPDSTVIVFTYKTVINKVDNNKNPLKDAEFKLEKKIKGANGAEDTWKEIAVVKNDAGTTFTFTGLDDGEYRLTETKTPSGYNSIDPITFKVTATHENNELKELNGEKVTGEITFTSNTTDGSLTTNIVNKKGSSLPSTGGMGTTIFYVAGLAIMAAAGILLISRKRMKH